MNDMGWMYMIRLQTVDGSLIRDGMGKHLAMTSRVVGV